MPPRDRSSRCLGQLTNNQAEYTALVRALQHALRLGAAHSIHVLSDSELMVKQMKGEYRVKNVDLMPLYEEARNLAKQFTGKVDYRHVRREHNSRADALCNEALDGKRTAARPAPVPSRPGAKSSPLRAEAVNCLREAVIAWAGGGDGPTPDEMWERLRAILEQHGVKLPS